MKSIILIMIGGALGALARFGVNQAMIAMIKTHFPLGMLLINGLGGLLMGVLMGLVTLKAVELPPLWGLSAQEFMISFLAIGFLGGFTSFSSFALDSYGLWQAGNIFYLALYICASILLAILGLFLGIYTIKFFN